MSLSTNRVSKSASEYILNCVGEYEEQMMRMLAKNERLQGRLNECASRVGQDVAERVWNWSKCELHECG